MYMYMMTPRSAKANCAWTGVRSNVMLRVLSACSLVHTVIYFTFIFLNFNSEWEEITNNYH
jgi:ABC-type Fe3+ transport system permease subunit